MKKSFVLLNLVLVSLLAVKSGAQEPSGDLWHDVNESAIAGGQERLISARHYRVVSLNLNNLQRILDQAPPEFSALATTRQVVLSLPLPNAILEKFWIVESPIMATPLAAKFPNIRTYSGQGVDNKAATCRFDLTPAGFHAIIFTTKGTIYIDPYSKGNITHYVSYFKRDTQWDANRGVSKPCQFEPDPAMAQEITSLRESGVMMLIGEELRTYRAAVAATGEYTQFHGGTVTLGLAAVVTAMNRVDGIYEREVAIRMTLVANNDALIYTDPNTDPYTNNNANDLLNENQTNLDIVIGNANYDVGHVFGTGGGGLAALGVVCRTGQKARGETGLANPIGDPFYVDYVAHEMGHQFGANHSFNGNQGSCGGVNRNAATAYEPGSGSTIMAYAGICGAQNLQPNSDDYFHRVSLDEIVAYSTLGAGNDCPTTTSTGNSPPVVDPVPGAYTIPINTPFTLTGSGSDPNSDAITFCWEQYDLGPAGHPDNPTDDAPIFRSFPAVASPARTFPKLSDLLNNTHTIGEILPSYTRTLRFRLTARDNRAGGGGNAYTAFSFDVTSGAGPFVVTVPNTAVTWTATTTQTVSWDVAYTNVAPVNCSLVNILLSNDGGNTFPTVLAASTPNDGSENIVVPAIATSEARVKVEAVNNVFFDMSNENFTIITPVVQVTVDQRRESDLQLTGTQVGRWGGASFINSTVPIPPFNFTVGSTEVLRGLQGLVYSPTEKYNRWVKNQTTDDPDVKNHHLFSVTSDLAGLISRFKTNYDATVQAQLIDGGNPGGSVEFKDPWLIDYPDPNYGNNLRNQGMAAPPKTVNYAANNLGTGTAYKGVFLDQPVISGKPYYSANALLTHPNINGFVGYFQDWTVSGADLSSPPSQETAVIFRSAGATVTARYKAYLGTSTLTGTASNNQRKMIYDDQWSQLLHMVYESVGEIWYTTSLNNGATWSQEVQIGFGSYPSLEGVSYAGGGPGVVIAAAVWQYEYDSGGNLMRDIVMSVLRNGIWESPEVATDFLAPQPPENYSSTPVVCGQWHHSPRYLHVVWHDYGTNNLRIASYHEGGHSQLAIQSISSTNANSLYPSVACDADGKIHLAWAESGAIYYTKITFNGSSYTFSPSKELVNPPVPYYNHGYPSIVVDPTQVNGVYRPSVAWEGIHWLPEPDVYAIYHKRRESSGWGSTSTWNPGAGKQFLKPSIGSSPPVKLWIGYYQAPDNRLIRRMYNGSYWSQVILAPTGQYPSMTVFRTIDHAKMVYRGVNGPPYNIGTTSQSMTKELMDDQFVHHREGILSIGESLLACRLRGIEAFGKPVEFFNYVDTLVIGRTGKWEEMFRTEAFEVTRGDTVSYSRRLEVFDGERLSDALRGGSKVEFRVEIVDAKSDEPLSTVEKYEVSAKNIPAPSDELRKVVLELGGTKQVYFRVNAGVPPNVEATASMIEHYFDVEDDSVQKAPESGSITKVELIPTEFELAQNYPNPFNPSTTFRYALPTSEHVVLRIFNVQGQEVATLVDQDQAAGRYEVPWNGHDRTGQSVGSGVYLYRLDAGEFHQVRRMLLLK